MNNNPPFDCPHYPSCKNCCLSQDVCAPSITSEAKRYFSTLGWPEFHVHMGPPAGWRCRAKLAVRGLAPAPKIGLFKQGTHEVVDIPLCRMHHPLINQGAAHLREWIRQEKIAPYDEKTYAGSLRYVQLVVERATQKVQLSLVINETPQAAAVRPKLETLWALGGASFWHSLWLNINTRRDNVIFGPEWELCKGDELLWETLAGTDVCFQPGSFAQANLGLFEEMLLSMRKIVPHGAKVAEFHAGVGAIGLCITRQCAWVKCGEINPHAQYCFERAKERLTPEAASRITWRQGKASALGALLEDADHVIVDPPRQGVEPELIAMLSREASVRRLIYISCGWESFQRDAARLLSGGWRLESAEGYLFFPGSNHLETLAVFEKGSG